MDSNHIILKKNKDILIRNGHPWIFSGAIQNIGANIDNGSECSVFNEAGIFIGYGLYSSKSSIAVRIYSVDREQKLDEKYFYSLIKKSIDFRVALFKNTLNTGAIRLVNSEGDNLSGLTVDWFAGSIVMQITSNGIFKRKDLITSIIDNILNPANIIVKTDPNFSKQEDYPEIYQTCKGTDEFTEVKENNILYRIELKKGQKTGFYCDQRENRKLLGSIAFGKKILDICSYTGGFSLNAAAGGAVSVTGVDSSKPAIDTANINRDINSFKNIEFIKDDALSFLKKCNTGDYDIIVLDPPKYAANSSAIKKAIKTYISLNSTALSLLNPGGILATHSCSGRVSPDEFMDIIKYAAIDADKKIQVFHTGAHAPDHPFVVPCFETRYLKSIFLRVL